MKYAGRTLFWSAKTNTINELLCSRSTGTERLNAITRMIAGWTRSSAALIWNALPGQNLNAAQYTDGHAAPRTRGRSPRLACALTFARRAEDAIQTPEIESAVQPHAANLSAGKHMCAADALPRRILGRLVHNTGVLAVLPITAIPVKTSPLFEEV
jgi:hypothetical protein